MTRYYYKKANKKTKQRVIKLTGLGISSTGFCIVLFVFTPLLSWTLFSAPAFFSQSIASPIPQINIVNAAERDTPLQSPVGRTNANFDSTNAAEWFPSYSIVRKIEDKPKRETTQYTISIPKINVNNAIVTTVDNDLAAHLVDFQGTGIPPDNGNAVVFGHSTLPYLFNPSNYRTILANAYKLQVGDEFFVHVDNGDYVYKIFSITVVNPDDTSVFTQNYDSSYLTLVTCTPPGFLTYRLVIRSRIEK